MFLYVVCVIMLTFLDLKYVYSSIFRQLGADKHHFVYPPMLWAPPTPPPPFVWPLLLLRTFSETQHCIICSQDKSLLFSSDLSVSIEFGFARACIYTLCVIINNLKHNYSSRLNVGLGRIANFL